VPTIEEKPRPAVIRPPKPRRRKLNRKQHNIVVYLNAEDRAALDEQADRFGVELSTYFRGLIWAVHFGDLVPTDQIFRS
jgi:hypothetical protein